MSPEPLECQATLGPAADVYSFGVVLFEMLTGHMPFEGDSPASIIFKQLKKAPPPPSSFRPEIGTALDELVLTCLSRSRRARFQTVEAVLLELERCLEQQSAGATPHNRRKRAVAGIIVVSLLAALAVIVNSVSWRAAPPVHVEAALKAVTAHGAENAATPDVVAEVVAARPPPAEPSAAPSPQATQGSRSNRKNSPAKALPVKAPPTKPSTTKPSTTKPPAALPPPSHPVPEQAPERWVPKRAPDFLL
jgi:serine/threonine protein kinase